MTVRLFGTLVALLAGVVFVGNAAAASRTSTSSNWAGYAVSPVDSTASYKTVSGSWVQPTATCSGTPAYAAFWVGLGGLDSSSQALEQIGTQAGCDQSGTPTYDAWYELVPAASVDLSLPVRAGDTMSASVTVSGHAIVLRIRNVTLGAQVVKKLRMRAPETSSAEWIAEAPSACTSYGRCAPLRLADFDNIAFTKAIATAGSHTGTISDPAWTATAIALQEDGFFQSRFSSDAPPAAAQPSPLSTDGSAFGIAWLQTSPPAQPVSLPAQPDSPPAA